MPAVFLTRKSEIISHLSIYLPKANTHSCFPPSCLSEKSWGFKFCVLHGYQSGFSYIVDHRSLWSGFLKFGPVFQPPSLSHLLIIDAAISMTDSINRNNIYRFISHGNVLPLSSWGDAPSGGAIPSTSTSKMIRGLIQRYLAATGHHGRALR